MTTTDRTDVRPAGLEGVRGVVLRPDDPGYEAEVAGFNLARPAHPDVVVGAADAHDVALAVRFARAARRPLVVHSTGHGRTADAADGVLVTTRRLTEVRIDARRRTARVGAGVRGQALADAAAHHGLAAVTGSSGAVGVVGFTLGGGLSPLGRALGWGADRVRAVELVTADGRVRRADRLRHRSLFWALRGARDGFGVVTALELELTPLRTVRGGALFFAADDAARVLHAWRTWAPAQPPEVGTSVAVLRLPPDPTLPEPLRGRTVVSVRFVADVPAARADALLAPLRRVATPVLDTVTTLPVTALDAVHGDPVGPLPAVERGSALGALPAAAVDALLATAGPQVPSALASVELRLLGGRLAQPRRGTGPVTARDAAFTVHAIGVPAGPFGDAAGEHAEAVVRSLEPWTRGAPLSFVGDVGPAQRLALWDPATRRRLQGVAAAVDPDGLLGGVGGSRW